MFDFSPVLFFLSLLLITYNFTKHYPLKVLLTLSLKNLLFTYSPLSILFSNCSAANRNVL